MRNLKRALSLTLASVMLLGMMVVGASAKGYPDVSEEDNVEAIEVLQAVQVMRGDDNGDFNPDSPVTRSEMAVIMALLLNYDYQYYEESCPFWDVPTWARGYVGVCYVRGIVAGYSDNTYGAADSVTAVQAAAMMMRALGYFQYDSDYADGFETATVRQGTRIGIFKGVNSNATEPLTRNQVAQMALNALKTPIVEPDDNTINIIDGNGNLIASGGQVNYVVVASNQSYARAIDRTEYVGLGLNQVTGYTVELGEQLYDGMLKLNDDIDAFKRPARAWEYNGKAIGLYAKEELLVYENVGEVTGKVLYDLLGKSILDNYDLSVALDGVDDPSVVRAINGYDTAGGKNNVDFVFEAADINRSNNGSLGATGTGVLTQVYVNPEKEEVHIAVINTYLARASQDYDTRREELVLNAYSVVKYKDDYVKVDKSGDSLQIRLGVDEFPLVESAKENDAFLVTFAEGEVQSAVPAEVLSGVTVSSFKVKDNVVVNGTTYKFTTTAGFDAEALKAYTGGELVNLKDTTYNIFLDAYGNLIGVQEVDAVKNYVFITAIDLNDSNLVNGTANAKAIFLDGTVDTIQVNMDKSTLNYYTDGAAPGGFNKNSILNTWCTFTKTNSDVYTVKQVSDVTGKVNEDDYVPGGAMNGSNLAQYHQHGFATDYTVNTKYFTLEGRNTSVGKNYSRVLGNEHSVYLTAELTNLTNQGGTWGVIKGVDTVTTGAENVNLNVWTDVQAVAEAETDTVKLGGTGSSISTDYASKGVYTLYNDDGIIIATVVVGEDDGTARNLVYVHSSSVNYEAYNGSSNSRASGDDMWTWTRNVISNGKEITLTEVSDGNSDLAAMNQYHWYQIKTNGDGEVTGVYRLADDTSEVNQAHLNLPTARLERYDDYALSYKRSAATDNIGEIAYTVQNGSNTILYWNQNYLYGSLSMNGRTLYVAHDDQTGFIVSSNVNWVVQQWDNNRKETYIDEGTTAAGLKSMIDEINRRNTNLDGEIEDYHYQVSAIIEGGIASSVVIYYNENDYARPGSGTTTTPSGDKDVTLTLVNGVWTLTRNDGGKVDGLTISEIQNLLLKAGCTNVSMTGNSWNFTFDGITCTGVPVTVVKGEGDDSNPEEKPEYAVNVTVEPEGIATVGHPDSAAEGDTVQLVIGEADGYVLDDIQLDGVSLGTTNSFTMPGHAVEVKVIFKAEPITGVNFTGSAEQDTDFTTSPKAEDGSFTIKAVNGALGVKVYGEEGCTVAPVASTVTAINDEAYTTWTVTPEEGAENVVVRVNKMRAQFTGSALVSVEVTDEAGVSMRMARTVTAYADGDAEGENLYFKVTFLGLTVNGEQDPTYTVAKVPGKQGLWFGADFGVDEANALLAALNGFAGDSLNLGLDTEVTEEEINAWLGEDTPDTPDEPTPIESSITAKVTVQSNGQYKAEFSEYRADGTAVEKLDAAQIANALNNSEMGKTMKWAFTEKDIDLTSTKEAVVGHAEIDIKTDLTAHSGKPTQLFAVTYPGPDGVVTELVDKDGLDVGTEVAEGISWLLEEKTLGATRKNAVAVAEGKTVVGYTSNNATTECKQIAPVEVTPAVPGMASYRDATYVAAMRLQSGGSGTAGITNTGVLVTADQTAKQLLGANYLGEDGLYAPINTTDMAVIQCGTKVYLTSISGTGSNAAGQGINIKVNGVDVLTVNVDEDGKIPTGANTPYFVIPSETAKDKEYATIVPTITAPDVTIYVDDEPLPDSKKFTSDSGDYYVIGGMTDYSLAWQNEDGEWVGIETGFTAADGNGNAKVTLAGITGVAAADENGEIHLVRAWKVAGADNDTEASRTWEAFTTWAPDDLVNPSKKICPSNSSAGNAYFPADGEDQYIWVQAADEGVILAAKDGSALDTVVNVNGVAHDQTGAVQGAWKVPVTGNIDANSFIELVTIDKDASERKLEMTDDLNEDKATDWLTIAGIEFDKDYGSKVSVSATWENDKESEVELKLLAPQVVKDDPSSPSKMEIQVKFSSDSDVSYGDKGTKTDLGNLTLTITAPNNTPIIIIVPVSIKVASE